jgi:hypothetical protein
MVIAIAVISTTSFSYGTISLDGWSTFPELLSSCSYYSCVDGVLRITVVSLDEVPQCEIKQSIAGCL